LFIIIYISPFVFNSRYHFHTLWIIICFISLIEMTLNTITLLQPDDWHAHLRDGLSLQRTVPDLAQQFARAICMPNTVPPVKTVEVWCFTLLTTLRQVK